MQQNNDNEALIRQYLLGGLDEGKQRQLEEQLLTDGECFTDLLVAEDELIDQYVSGALSEQERENFELHFLVTPERHQKLNFARTLRKYISDAGVAQLPEPAGQPRQPASWKRFLPSFVRARNPLIGFSFAAALLLVAIGGSWLAVKNLWPQKHDRSPAILTVPLTPGLVRDAGVTKRIVIPAHVEIVQLQLELETTEHQSYRAVVETDQGRSVFSADELKPQMTDAGRVVILSVPASLLTGGDYQLKLSAPVAGGEFEAAGRYYFRIPNN